MAVDTQPVNTNDASSPFGVAIIGCGLIGLHVALGLIKRNIPVTIYEQAAEFREIGAGVGFSGRIKENMGALDSRIPEALSSVSIESNQALRWVDGTTQEDLSLRPADKVYDMQIPDKTYFFCHRAQFITELMNLLPSGCIKLGKRLDTIERDGDTVVMTFTDKTKERTDAVIGCDGLKSRVRYLVMGDNNPAAIPHYANESAYRCLADMAKVAPLLGNFATGFTAWIGHGASIITYPVANNRYLNVAAFVRDEHGSWPDQNKHTVQANKAEIIEAFSTFGPTARKLIEALPEDQSRWGLFDTLDYPLPTYAFGPIAVAGDAAHGSTPHHGSGAAMGIEDAIVLATILEKAATVLSTVETGAVSKATVLANAFQAYDSVRRERSQWLVSSSRRQGQLSKLEIPEVDSNEKFIKDTSERVTKLYFFDWKAMIVQGIEDFERRMAGSEKV
ncbi:putative zeaxanthin epoxidase [Talaromyces proteolyticus]|uniref:Zeaxanthin epoxidase n=1 Tax=Talaromyces proteolyticus TaxID=1131652 RepID=A0AAD4Q6L7_9EURO|nr:putative zeaxanthin epoxidase [Talaromyces proteolyticus]KAH8705462.1 putative zeaxanthin epoxidase [Talaromyces proteolyticus]